MKFFSTGLFGTIEERTGAGGLLNWAEGLVDLAGAWQAPEIDNRPGRQFSLIRPAVLEKIRLIPRSEQA